MKILSELFSMDSSFTEKWFYAAMDPVETWNIFDLVGVSLTSVFTCASSLIQVLCLSGSSNASVAPRTKADLAFTPLRAPQKQNTLFLLSCATLMQTCLLFASCLKCASHRRLVFLAEPNLFWVHIPYFFDFELHLFGGGGKCWCASCTQLSVTHTSEDDICGASSEREWPSITARTSVVLHTNHRSTVCVRLHLDLPRDWFTALPLPHRGSNTKSSTTLISPKTLKHISLLTCVLQFAVKGFFVAFTALLASNRGKRICFKKSPLWPICLHLHPAF